MAKIKPISSDKVERFSFSTCANPWYSRPVPSDSKEIMAFYFIYFDKLYLDTFSLSTTAI